MGTRSLVGIPDAEHGWKARYVHWDGYPSGVGEALRVIVNRDGYTAAVKTLTEENYGWSSINGREEQEMGAGYNDGRFVAVPGYGIAYTTEGDPPQSSEDEWQFGDDAEGTWCEWAYVLGESEIGVFVVGGSKWRQVGVVGYRDEAGMARVEGA